MTDTVNLAASWLDDDADVVADPIANTQNGANQHTKEVPPMGETSNGHTSVSTAEADRPTNVIAFRRRRKD